MLPFLDAFFFLFHAALVVFNLTGWIWRKTRRLHLASISVTIVSWFGLGLFYGIGYCPCTDWHWQVKRAMGQTGLPASYVKYYLDELTGLDFDAGMVDVSVAVLGFLSLALSIILNVRDWRQAGNRES